LYTFTQLLVMPIAFWIGATWAGSIGVALGWALAYPLSLTWLANEALLGLNVGWRLFLAQLWSPFVATTAMTASVLLLQWWWAYWGPDVATLRLSMSIFAGATSYTVGLWLIGGRLVQEIKEVSGWVVGKGQVLDAEHG